MNSLVCSWYMHADQNDRREDNRVINSKPIMAFLETIEMISETLARSVADTDRVQVCTVTTESEA